MENGGEGGRGREGRNGARRWRGEETRPTRRGGCSCRERTASGEEGDETTRGVSRAGEREGERGERGRGRLSGGWRIVGGEGGWAREPGLGEILRGLRAMARAKRARAHVYVYACVHAHKGTYARARAYVSAAACGPAMVARMRAYIRACEKV